MKNTVCNIILSILENDDPKFVENKVTLLEDQLTLNEVEKKIVKDIKDNVYVGKVISPEFIQDKYSYYTNTDPNVIPAYLSKDAIDSAVSEIRVQQMKLGLSKELLNLGGELQKLDPKEIKERFSRLYTNSLLENRNLTITNGLKIKESAYSDKIEGLDGMLLGIPKVEHYAGKAPKGNIVSILGFTGSFKSTYALNISYINALDGSNILYLSLESTAKQMIDRLVLNHIAVTARSRDESIEGNHVRDKKLTAGQQKLYDDKHNELVTVLDNHLILVDSSEIEYDTFLDMQNTLRNADKVFIENTGKGIDGVVVDQLSLLKYTIGSGKRVTYDGAILNEWVSFFRKQALNFLDSGKQIVVFMVSQTSRDSFAEASKPKKKGRYEASCTSDSHELERASLTMITLFKDYEAKDTLLVNIPKARDGSIPDKPISVEVYGEYYHVGPIDFRSNDAEFYNIDAAEINLGDLINK